MTTENATKSAIGFLSIIVVGALLSAVLGGAFAALIGTVSPEFVGSVFGNAPEEGIVRYALSVGMIWGLFIGAAVSGFACFLAVVIKILKIRFEYKRDGKANR
jgi:hypothetical protein